MKWPHHEVDKHFWAFYYYCRRQGDKVQVIKHSDGTATLIVHKETDA